MTSINNGSGGEWTGNLLKYLGAAIAASQNPQEMISLPAPRPTFSQAVQTLGQNAVAHPMTGAPTGMTSQSAATVPTHRLLLGEFLQVIHGNPQAAEQIVPGITRPGALQLIAMGDDGRPYVEIPPDNLDAFRALATRERP